MRVLFNMDNFYVILVLVAVIYTIVVIVLPFKIWSIAKNVSTIVDLIPKISQKSVEKRESLYVMIVKLEMTGRHKEAIQTLVSRMNEKLYYLIDEGDKHDYPIEKLQGEWDKTLEGCEKYFSYLNEEMPNYFRSFKFVDFRDSVGRLKN